MSEPQKILIVDDEVNLCRVLEKVLTLEGYQTISATSGQEALKILKKKAKVHLMLLDLKMPGVDGLEVLKTAGETKCSYLYQPCS
jgi:CheY-like chemotaxis protein